jgi:hypothetical protein
MARAITPQSTNGSTRTISPGIAERRAEALLIFGEPIGGPRSAAPARPFAGIGKIQKTRRRIRLPPDTLFFPGKGEDFAKPRDAYLRPSRQEARL